MLEVEAQSEILTLFIIKGVAHALCAMRVMSRQHPDRACFTLLDYFQRIIHLLQGFVRADRSTMTRAFAFLVVCYAVSLSIQTVSSQQSVS